MEKIVVYMAGVSMRCCSICGIFKPMSSSQAECDECKIKALAGSLCHIPVVASAAAKSIDQVQISFNNIKMKNRKRRKRKQKDQFEKMREASDNKLRKKLQSEMNGLTFRYSVSEIEDEINIKQKGVYNVEKNVSADLSVDLNNPF